MLSIRELRKQFQESMEDLRKKIEVKDLEGCRIADKRTKALSDELKKEKLKLELDLY